MVGEEKGVDSSMVGGELMVEGCMGRVGVRWWNFRIKYCKSVMIGERLRMENSEGERIEILNE